MSEYMERHAVSRMIGAPPGYVGYEAGGQLTEAVRRHPYSVILLDEVEKAHPEVMNVLLQLLDDGRLTDGKGRVVDFSNTLVIMTSNLGSARSSIRPATAARREGERVTEALRGHFRPEFLNRLDETMMFRSLREEELRDILELQVQRFAGRLEDRKVGLRLNETALEWLVALGYDPVYGARSLKRAIQRELETPHRQGDPGGHLPGRQHHRGQRGGRAPALPPGRTGRDPEGGAGAGVRAAASAWAGMPLRGGILPAL